MSKRYYSGVIKASPTTSPGIFDTGTVFVASGSAVSVYGASTATAVTLSNPMTSGNGIYVPTGGTVTTVGNYQIITFTGSGSFTVNQTGSVELMMIGGGGGAWGGQSRNTCGGSSGGMIYYGSNPWEFSSGTALTLVGGTTYTVTIGAGGGLQYTNTKSLPNAYSDRANTLGGNSSIVGGSINLVAYGGAGGEKSASSSASGAGDGPGAGSAYYGNPDYPSTAPAPSQGYAGGQAYVNTTSGANSGGGGGGCGALGRTAIDTGPGWGGNGFLTDISGTVTWYGAGGGGGTYSTSSSRGATGGSGGGGTGGWFSTNPSGGFTGGGANATPGTANTGSGGGGAAYTSTVGITPASKSGAQGGSGILIMKVPLYNIDPSAITAAQTNLIALGNTATGGTVTYSGNYRIHTFTGSGTFTAAHTGYIEYLCIAGGGGGGGGQFNPNPYTTSIGGGGGAGGYLEHYASSAIGTNFQGPRIYVNAGDTVTVVVGGAGASNAGSSISGNLAIPPASGTDSYILNTVSNVGVVSYGGGAGGHGYQSGTNNTSTGPLNGKIGGSGGGGASWSGQMNSTSVSLYGIGASGIGEYGSSTKQGYSGGDSQYYGGGAGGSGQGATTSSASNYKEANNGRSSSITGASVTYSAGGGRKVYAQDLNYFATVNSGNGGAGGTPGQNAQAVSGSNGLTAPEWYMSGKSGGSGIVIIRYRFQ